MKLLFLNALKGLKKKKVQMCAIIIMVLLSTGIYTAMNTALDRLEGRYYDYLESQNVEYFSFEPVIDYTKDITSNDLEKLKKSKLKNITSEEKLVLGKYEACYLKGCDAATYQSIAGLFKKYDATIDVASRKIDQIKDQYGFNYEIERSKILSEDRYMIKAFPYEQNRKINKPFLVEGRFPENKDEITVLPKFATSNYLSIGGTYTVGGKAYTIVGYAYASDYIYPLISFNVPIFDEKYNNIVFLHEDAYESFQGLKEDTYAAQFNEKLPYKNRDLSFFAEEGQACSGKLNCLFTEQPETVTLNMNTMIRIMRTDMLQIEFNTHRTFAQAFLYLLLGISVFIIMVITKKRIDDERLQIGVLKSLGYRSWKIAISYLVYPIIGAIIGGILGYGIGTLLNTPITSIYMSYFTVPLGNFTFDGMYLLSSILVPLLVLSVLSYFIAIFMLRKKPLALLKEGSNLKVNFFSKVVKKVTSFFPFNYRFKYSLASRSLGKLFVVALTSFCTGLLIVLMLIGVNLFNSMIDDSFSGMSYDYMISYSAPQTTEQADDDLVLEGSFTLEKILDGNNNEKTLEEADQSIKFSGIDENPKYLKVLDKQKKDLTPLIQGRDIIINQNMKEIFHIEIGDTLVVSYNEKEYSYHVVGICNEFLSMNAYVNRKTLSTDFGSPLVFNKKYSNQEKYGNMSSLDKQELNSISSIFSLDDLERNIRKQMDTVNSSLYLIIGFASFMALVIIAVIANIVVEENKKTISLMKVMGYQNKRISSIVLNIYTPIVIVAYLLSIPAMIAILKAIVESIAGDMNMAIPISLSPWMALVGLIGLLIGYYIAIYLSRRVLNKVPLAVALKRE